MVAPRIARQWHPSKNGKLTPFDLLPHSTKPVWWQCAAGHAWRAKPDHRMGRGANAGGCPFCRRRQRKVATRKVMREVVRFPG